MSPIQLLSIQVGLPKVVTDSDDQGFKPAEWTTAFFKQAISGPVWVSRTNLEGDLQGSPKTHGGPEKAVCLYPFEHYAYWQKELHLPELDFGAFAENFTVQGQLEEQSCIGDTLRIGEVQLQVSQPRPPCWRLARWWQRKDFVARMEQTGRTGWYCRVIKEGYAEAGTAMELLERPYPQWPVSLANHLLYESPDQLGPMKELASCELLSESWRESLLQRRAKLIKAAKEMVAGKTEAQRD